MVAVATAVLIVQTLWHNLTTSTLTYRALPQAEHQEANIKIRFADDISMGELHQFIEEKQLTLIEGPNAVGLFYFSTLNPLSKEQMHEWEKDARVLHASDE